VQKVNNKIHHLSTLDNLIEDQWSEIRNNQIILFITRDI